MKKNLTITALLGAIAIMLGAFGAHGLKEILSPEDIVSFQTGVRYQMFHVFALLFVNMYQNFSEKTKNTISYLFFAGILCFSGSIYFIKLTGITMAKPLYLITPLGGMLFIIGWLIMAFRFRK